MIYFLQAITGGPVKIGFSDDVERRRRQLESHYGCPLAILATMKGGRDEEREIHERFCALRFGRTEQFRPGAELMAFIGRPLLVGSNPDAVEAMPEKVDVRHINVELSEDTHKILRKLAADEGVSMAAFARETVERVVREEFKRRGLK